METAGKIKKGLIQVPKGRTILGEERKKWETTRWNTARLDLIRHIYGLDDGIIKYFYSDNDDAPKGEPWTYGRSFEERMILRILRKADLDNVPPNYAD